jgi:hypothetical protein
LLKRLGEQCGGGEYCGGGYGCGTNAGSGGHNRYHVSILAHLHPLSSCGLAFWYSRLIEAKEMSALGQKLTLQR